MFEEAFAKVSAEVSGDRSFGHVVSVSQFHRIQASPGFRKAAEYCVDVMLEKSPNALVIHYPAEAGAKFWHYPSFEEWYGRKGILKILGPESLSGKLADFEECPIALIQRSVSTPPAGITTELVYVGDGNSSTDYRRARGKIAICDAHSPHDVFEAAVKAGVVGILLYRQRPLEPLRKGFGVQGARQYNSFWWQEQGLFGFVLTPEQGQRLVSYLASPEAQRKPVRVWAHVESASYPGTLEVVTSLLPGRETKEIILMAHLCHPQPSAGDNASGVGAVLEAHRVLCHLVQKGDLPQPRYGIRFLLMPEITGSFAFLSRSRGIRKQLLFGLNLDMVGQWQEVTGSTLCVEAPALAASSFTPYFLEEVVKRAFKGSKSLAGNSDLLSARVELTPFSGGSDHIIFSDPKVGVPTPMLIQWPDKYYHTSGDTPDKVSPDVMRRIVIAAATYAYTCAFAAEKDLVWIAALTGRAMRRYVAQEMGGYHTSEARNWITPEFKARFLSAVGDQALRSVRKLAPESRNLKLHLTAEDRALAQTVKRETALAASAASLAGVRKPHRHLPAETYSNLWVKRLLPGPTDLRALMSRLTSTKRAQYRRWMRKEKQAHMMEPLALYWANGRRSLREISNLVAAELGSTNPDYLRFYFEMLDEVGIVEIKS
jgi:Peptidase family M28